MSRRVSLMQLLERINLSGSLDDLVKNVVRDYQLGEIQQPQLIWVGYSDVNIKIVTAKGKYLLKIFNKAKSYQNVSDYIKGMQEFRKIGVPTPVLRKFRGKFIYKISGQRQTSYLCLMEFFEGKNFHEIKASKKDLAQVTGFMAKINRLKFRISPNYDSWGTVNLLKEFKLKGKYLKTSDLKLVKPVINEFKKINFRKLPKSVIHGDLHKDHVLKNKRGQYCVIDLDVMDFNARILDLAIFLATFVGDKLIYKFILRQYQNYIKLTRYEKEVLPVLIKATYAIYLIRANYELMVNKDTTKQTSDWLSLARKGLNFIHLVVC